MYKKWIVIILTAAILLAGCSTPGTAGSSSETAQAETNSSSAEIPQSETDSSSAEIPRSETDSSSAEISQPDANSSSSENTSEETDISSETAAEEPDTSSAETSQQETDTEAEPQLYEFNPHLHSDLLAKEIPQENWDAMYSLSDALRTGADTFECSGREAYDWCMDSVNLANLIPAACMRITSESSDGTIPFENGRGRIYYKMPAEEYVVRQAEFEKMIADVLNEYLEKDDNDFEKCLKLYDYMESNYSYDYDPNTDEKSEDGYVYSAFMTHKGQCIDLSAVYCHLLLQAGVDALNVGCFYDNMDHAWTYAIVNGQGYHIDPTWALKDVLYTDSLYLSYFMMTDEIRTSTGCPVDDLTVQMLPKFWVKSSSITLPATDDRYYVGDSAVFKSLDEKNKILCYLDEDGAEQKLNYDI